jgi:tripartite-type tricarboxylate transporter receptor subunit TctC
MNEELRRHPRQSGSASSTGVPVASSACEVSVDRRRFLIGMRTIATIGAGTLALASGWRSALAQSYPTAPVKVIVTTGAGGAPDVIARIVAEGLTHRFGQQAFVANHPGAAGSIGMKVAGSAPADGYTLLFALSSSFVALPEIAKDYPYDLVRDFVSIGFVCEQPMAIAVPPSLGVNTLGELIDYVKKRPGEINVAVLSRGGIPHLTSEWIKLAAGLDWTSINYPGTPAGLSDVMGGRVQVIMDGLPSLAGSINGGTLKLLAVGSARRLPNRPDTPTIAETLPAIPRALGFFALMAPPGTPAPIAAKISDDLRAVLNEPSTKKRFEDIASYIHPMSGAELLAYIRTEQALWKPVIEQISTFKAAPK